MQLPNEEEDETPVESDDEKSGKAYDRLIEDLYMNTQEPPPDPPA